MVSQGRAAITEVTLKPSLEGWKLENSQTIPSLSICLETFLRGMETVFEVEEGSYNLAPLKPSLEGWKQVFRDAPEMVDRP